MFSINKTKQKIETFLTEKLESIAPDIFCISSFLHLHVTSTLGASSPLSINS